MKRAFDFPSFLYGAAAVSLLGSFKDRFVWKQVSLYEFEDGEHLAIFLPMGIARTVEEGMSYYMWGLARTCNRYGRDPRKVKIEFREEKD